MSKSTLVKRFSRAANCDYCCHDRSGVILLITMVGSVLLLFVCVSVAIVVPVTQTIWPEGYNSHCTIKECTVPRGWGTFHIARATLQDDTDSVIREGLHFDCEQKIGQSVKCRVDGQYVKFLTDDMAQSQFSFFALLARLVVLVYLAWFCYFVYVLAYYAVQYCTRGIREVDEYLDKQEDQLCNKYN